MALNKRKVLEAARKFAQKGAKAKALKEYNKLLQADARDAKLLLEVGDAYRRWGQNEEAIAQYGKVAQQYRQDGFDARAVAVFKQILNLDPKNYGAYVSLAELYQRMGLDSEAVGALQTAADGYHKEGRKSEALDLLRQMAALDPTNTTSRLKVAELLRQEGMDSEAITEYEAVITELENQEDRDQLAIVFERILEVKPDHLSALNGFVRHLMTESEFEKAEPLAVQALTVSKDTAQYDLLMDLYAQMGEESKLADATRSLAKLYRDRGDEEKARDLMQRLPVDDSLSSSGLGVDVSEVAEPDLADEELLEDEEEPFLSLDQEHDVAGGDLEFELDETSDDLELDLEAEVPPAPVEAVSAPPTTVEEPLPEGDPDQLLAEANVYLRYGKRDQAITSLRGILAQEPNHRAALEKLGEAYAEDEQNSEAVRVWLQAAELDRAAGDSAGLAVLRDRIAVIDPETAERVGAFEQGETEPIPDPSDASVSNLDLELDLDVDLDLDLDSEMETSESPAESVGLDFSVASEDFEDADEFEIDLEEDSDSFEAATPNEASLTQTNAELVAEEASGTVELPDISLGDDDSEFEIEIDSDDLSLEDENDLLGEDVVSVSEDSPSEALEASSSAIQSGQSTTTSAKIVEELEEAEFYIAQEMFDEAEVILTRVLEMAPNHPAAMLRLGEIVSARGGEPDEAVSQVGLTSSSSNPFEVTARFGEDEAEDTVTSQGLVDETAADDLDVEIDFDLDEDLEDAVQETADQQAAADEGAEELDLRTKSSEEEVALEADVESVADNSIEVEADLSAELDGDTETQTEPSLEAAAIVDEQPIAEVDEADLAEAVEEPEGDVEVEADSGLPDEEPEVEAEAEPEVEVAAESQVETKVETEPTDAAETFDLREALADVFAEDEATEPDEASQSGVLSTVEDGFESIFSDFKRGVTATLEDGDFDTRYDLGIAYREMGLYEDAIGEFTVCLDSPDRRFDSLYLMGLCSRDLTRFPEAVSHLEQALALPDLPEDRMAGVYFDLAEAEVGMGDNGRAIVSLQRVIELDPEFPGAADRLAALQAGETPISEIDLDTDGFESFDELFGDEEDDTQGDVAVAVAASVETFESFDDVVSEAEAAPVEEVEVEEEILEAVEIVEEDGLPEAELAEAVAVAEEISVEEAHSGPEPEKPKKSARKKKISFV